MLILKQISGKLSMKQSRHYKLNRNDFAIEAFDNEILIFRLFDKRTFRLDQSALLIFNILLKTNSDINAAFNMAKKQNLEINVDDIKDIQRILFKPKPVKISTK